MPREITEDEKVGWSQYEPVPVGLYEAEITKIEETENPFKKGEFQYLVYFKLNYRNAQGEEVVISRMISKRLSPKSKLFEVLTAIDGKKPTKASYPEGIRISGLIGKKCRVTIRNQESKEGNTYSKIDVFLPLEDEGKKGGQG